MGDIPTQRRNLINRRSMWMCEWCGRTGQEIHHRKRGHPRNHDAANMVRLCGPCHHICTYDMPKARDYGFVTDSITCAMFTPIAVLGLAWATLTEDGAYRCGSVTFASFDQIHKAALSMLHRQRIGPEDTLSRGELSIVSHGVPVDSGLGERRGGDRLTAPAESPSIPAGFLIQPGETLADFHSRQFEEL